MHQESISFAAALTTVLDYLWDDERKAYEALPRQERDGHIFDFLQVLAARRGPVTSPGYASVRATAEADACLFRARKLAARLRGDTDETQDESMEAACELAALLEDLDVSCCEGALPTAWQAPRS